MSTPSEQAKRAATEITMLMLNKQYTIQKAEKIIDAALAELAKDYHVQHLNLEKAEAEIARLLAEQSKARA